MNNDSIILIFIFITHLFLHCWAILAFMNISYIVYNVFFMISLLWSVHENKCSGPTLVALLLNMMSIIMDAMLIGVLWYSGSGYHFVISVLAAFLNMVYRLVTTLIIYQIWRKRTETETDMANIQSVTRDLNKYLYFGRSAPNPQTTNGGAANP